MTRDATTAFARTLVDEWARAGTRHAVVAPGSRSAPLALALAADDRIRVHVVLDERSAAFFALGIGRATGRPALVLCTSGTAAAELHPAVLEASHGDVPLLVCTANRPPELQGVGAPQTVDQSGLYGGSPRLALDVPPPEDRPGAGSEWRALAARAWAATVGPRPGPVHVDLAFREPLVPTGAPLVDAPGRAGGAPWAEVEHAVPVAPPEQVERLAEWVRGEAQGWIVAGWGAGATPAAVDHFAKAAGWPVLADPISGLHATDHAIGTADVLLRVPAFTVAHRPAAVLRLGANPTSKAVDEALGSARVVRVDPTGVVRDPAGNDSLLVVADPDDLLTRVADRLEPRDSAWRAAWGRADAAARAALDAHLDADDEPFDGRIARDVLAAVPGGSDLFVASSMPVRDLATFGVPRADVSVHANRGVNGIDGLVSTVLGLAAARPESATVGLLGDLAVLHDSNGLIGASRRDLDAVLVVVDNDGGGIFSFLPQAAHAEHFETLFGTPHGVDIAAVCAAHGVPAVEVERARDLRAALGDAIDAGGVRAVVVRTDRHRNVARHRAAVDAVAAALG